MNHTHTPLYFTSFFLLFALTSPVKADRNRNIETIFNWAEQNYSHLFSPSGASTNTISNFENHSWRYRFYPDKATYTGINESDEIYIYDNKMGGLVYIDLLPPVLNLAKKGINHDCVTYTPTKAGETIKGTWDKTSSTDKHNLALTMPQDLGGGYLRVKLSTHNVPGQDNNQPAIEAYTGDSGDLITAGSDLDNTEWIFSVAAGQTYNFGLYNFIEAENVDYTFTWEFTSRVDCYEPNNGQNFADGQQNARKIPTNKAIEAFMLPGYVTNNINRFDDNLYDWYQFTLAARSEVSLEIVKAPSDSPLRQYIYSSDGSELAQVIPPDQDNDSVEDAAPYKSGTGILDPGTYLVKVWTDFSPEYTVNLTEDEDIPDSFDTPYQFRVNAKPI